MTARKLLLIVDNRQITRWQLEALRRAGPILPLVVLSCSNTRLKRQAGKHFLYYVLRAVTFPRRWTGKVAIDQAGLEIEEIVDFASDYEGAWQKFPEPVQARIREARPEAVIKFGMSLLRVPADLDVPILSYHHGDPDLYRGRPAGFYEMLDGRERMGQIVQIIGNKLDAGEVVAFAETRTFPHSYRATLGNAYAHSPLLLRGAIANALEGRRLPKPCTGRNYRLPGNWTVFRFCARVAAALTRRLVYGALFEKKWNVSVASAPTADLLGNGELPRSGWTDVPRLGPYSFYADPFWHPEPPGLLVEAMNARSGLGELVFVPEAGPQRRVSEPGRHFSYPAAVAEAGQTYVVPEVSHWSTPRFYRLRDGALEPAGRLDLDEPARVADPTFHWHDGRLYLFGNKADAGCDALHLWSSDSLFGRFVEHPASPVLISPFGGRMAGQIVSEGGSLYRLGQNALRGYGDGTLVFRVDGLGPAEYRESFVREIRFDAVRGPHTLNWAGDRVVFDWYRDRFAPLAWLRRLRARHPAARAELPEPGGTASAPAAPART